MRHWALMLALLAMGSKGGGVPDARPARLPASSLLDFRETLQTPAGRRGFLTVGKDGHFYWGDGSRARFWGINVSSTRLNIPNEQIEQVVGNFARAGLNLVRLEAVDNRNCLLGRTDAPDSQTFDLQYLDRLDRWMDALRRHGLYYYLDLLDFRTFKEGDGVLNGERLDRGARPYAVFDPYLIQLQKEYATRLLTHRNPYSGLRPVDDPALALVEICNEHGFFLHDEKLETLVEPYRANLRERWNAWLLARYGTRAKLEAAWGMFNGWKALRPEEDPAAMTVLPPSLTPAPLNAPPGMVETRRAPARLRDTVAFLVSLQRAYFREMRAHLRSIGLRIPVTAVVSNNIIPDVASVAQECDFTSENWYGDNPNMDSRAPGVRFVANRNLLRADDTNGFAPFTAALRWNRKPVVIREWAIPWPNRRRAASVPEALAYASLQDFDAVLLFGYQTNRAPNGAEADALNDYAFQSDPTVWGLYALAGQAFLKRAIRPAWNTITLTYPEARRNAWPNGLGDLHRASWVARLNSITQNRMPDDGIRRSPTFTRNHLAPTGSAADRKLLVEALKRIGSDPKLLAAGVWRSDHGQIVRYTQEGRLEARAPRLRMIAGEFTPGRIYDLGGGVRFSTPTRFGALLVLSLDGRPVESSRHLVAKMVSRAENTGEALTKAAPGMAGEWALTEPGKAPVLTFGRSAELPTRLWISTAPASDANRNPKSRTEKPLLALWMVDGTWEMEWKRGDLTLICDTPGLTGLAQGRSFTTTREPVEIVATRTPVPDSTRMP